VRTQGRAIDELFGAGDALHGAQADLLAGEGDGAALRAANERERATVDGLVDTARGLLTSDGHELSPAIVERVADTLHAAALDAGAREQVRDGRLERELRHVGMGLGESTFAAAPPKATKAPAKTPERPAQAKPTRRDPSAHERAKAARAAAKQAQAERAAERKAARVAEAQARRRAERAASALRAAAERRERAADALAKAEDALAAAREEAEAAAEAHRRAQEATG
jgi:hypothetical protein